MNCPKCNATLSDTAKFCDSCGVAVETKQAAKYAAPDGFAFDDASGLYYRIEYDAASGEAIGATWFNAVTGEYRQSRYDTAQTVAPSAAPDAQSPIPDWQATASGGQPSFIDPRSVKSTAAKKNRKAMAVIVVLLVVCGAGATVWFTGLYKNIPFLNPAVASDLPAGIAMTDSDPANLPQFTASEGIDHQAHVDTRFAVSAADSEGNTELLNGVTLIFDGAQTKVTQEDVTDVVLTKDEQPIPVEYEAIWTVFGGGDGAPVQTSCEILFDPPLSAQTTGQGAYVFSCNVQGVPYGIGDFLFPPASEPAVAEGEAAAASWATVYADFIRNQITESSEYLHFSDIGVFPVHTMEGQTAAIMQAAFYEIPGFDYPVMVLLEFLPQENNPGALDTFPFEMAYLVKDGAVAWPTTDEYAAIYAENEESGMTFINGEAFAVFELVSWQGDIPAGDKVKEVYDWLVSQQ